MNSSPIDVTIRPAVLDDVAYIFELIYALADYEQLTHEVTGNPERLQDHLFGHSQPHHQPVQAIVAEFSDQIVGFALFFVNYSTLLIQPGLYLEDLFVLPNYRGQGIGKSLLIYLAQLAQQQSYCRLQWSVLDWNTPAINFYQAIGAEISPDMRICRVSGSKLAALAELDPSSLFSSPSSSLRSFNLRPATALDVAQLFELVQSNIEFDGKRDQMDGNIDRFSAHLFQQHYGESVLAEYQSQPVGVGLVSTTYSTFLTLPGLFIEDLFVLPASRGQGIGTAILAYWAKQAIDRGYGRLEWRVRDGNQAAIAFYQRLGATILPDWRVCQMYEPAIAALAAKAPLHSIT